MARFDEEVPEPAIVPGVACDYDCDHPICEGDRVVLTYEGDYVHDDCWRAYCDEMYAQTKGYIGADGAIK